MAHEIYDLVESEKIRRLYYGSPNRFDERCNLSWGLLRPGFRKTTLKERKHIHALFDAINRHGVEPS